MESQNGLTRRGVLCMLGLGAGMAVGAPILAACGQSTPAPSTAGQAVATTQAVATQATGAQAPAAVATSVAAASNAVTAGSGGAQIVVWSGQINTSDESPAGKWSTWIRNNFVQKNPQYTLRVEF